MLKNMSKLIENLGDCENYIQDVIDNKQTGDPEVGRLINKCMGQFNSEDMGLLEPERSGPGGRNRVYSSRDRTRLKLTLRAKRLGLSLIEAKELIDMYDSPRDTGPQLKKFMVVLAEHRQQLESQLADLHATLEEVKTHEKDARNLLARSEKGASKKVSA